MPILRVLAGANAGSVYDLSRERILIGRDFEATVQVPDQGVSRHHAEIFRVGELYIVRDLGSRNGTFVNDRQVSEQALRQGDRIRVGGTTFAFEDRPELLQESGVVKFYDTKFDPQQTISLRTSVLRDSSDLTPPGAVTENTLLGALERVAEVLSSTADFRRILNQVTATVGEAVGAREVYVLYRRQQAEREEYEVLAAWPLHKGKEAVARVSKTAVEHVCRQQAPLLVNHAQFDQEFSSQDSIITHGIRSILCAPLRIRGTVLGMLYAVDTGKRGGFSAEDLELFSAAATQLGLAIGFFRAQRQQDVFFRRAMGILVAAIEHRLPQRKGAGRRIAEYCAAVAAALGLEVRDVRYAWLAGLLHDVAVLGLSDQELAQTHLLALRRNRATEELLGEFRELQPVVEALLNQEERYDGSGRPEGKRGDEIPVLAQILACVKAFGDQVIGDLERGGDHSVREAVREISKRRGTQFAPEVVDAFVRCYRQGQLLGSERAPGGFSI